MEVNRQIASRCPDLGMDYPGQNPAALRRVALNQLSWTGRLVATGGPLTYGLSAIKDQWCWCLWVGTENYQRVRLKVADIVRQADEAALSQRWQRSGQPTMVLALEAPLPEYASFEAATAWSQTRLRSWTGSRS
jgi:hypothetical protein